MDTLGFEPGFVGLKSDPLPMSYGGRERKFAENFGFSITHKIHFIDFGLDYLRRPSIKIFRPTTTFTPKDTNDQQKFELSFDKKIRG